MQASTATVKISLSPAEIERGKAYLKQTNDCVTGAIKGVGGAQWSFKPANGGWSIGEIAEHIVFVQERVLGILREALPAAPAGPAERDNATIESIIINQFPNRLEKFTAPFATPPLGLTPKSAAARVSENSQTFANHLESTPDLRDHVLESPPLKRISNGEYGVSDGYQWILAAAAHTERHVKQILEVKADPNFPEN
jgi:hypothetical protein